MGDSTFHTPKLESSFFDPRITWDTSDPYASSPEFCRTPQKFALGTPLRLPDFGSDRNNGATEAPNLKTVRLEQSESARRLKRNSASLGENGPRTVESAKSAASMQTPPPSSASTRKAIGFGQARNQSTPGGQPETPSRLLEASPRMFGNLHSSPDLFQLSSLDSSTAPSFLPQHRLFYDEEDVDQQNGGGGLAEATSDPFDSRPTHRRFHDPTSLPPVQPLTAVESFPNFPASHDFGLRSAHSTDIDSLPAPFSTSPRLPTTRLLEDPAMFLSSPARRFGGPQPSPARRLFSRETRQPYHHQTEESKREELRRAQISSLAVDDDDDVDDDYDDYSPRKPRRLGVTRSLSQNLLPMRSSRSRPPLSHASFSGPMASTSGIRKSPSKSRSSPLKSLCNQPSSPVHLAAAAPGAPMQSESLVLKIGKDGRAKTEMQVVAEPPTAGLLGGENNSSTTEDENDYFRHRSVFPWSDSGRSTFEPSEAGSRPLSKGSAYSSTTIHSGRNSPWAGLSRAEDRRSQYRPISESRRMTPTKRPPSAMPHPDLTRTSSSTLDHSCDEDSGDAQHALRQVLKGRNRSLPHHTISGSKVRASRCPLPMTHLRSSPPPRFGTRGLDSSPTTVIDPALMTPASQHTSTSGGTRCVCSSMENGGHLMIQWWVLI